MVHLRNAINRKKQKFSDFSFIIALKKSMRSKISIFLTQRKAGQNMKLPQTWVIKPTIGSSAGSSAPNSFLFDKFAEIHALKIVLLRQKRYAP